MKSNTTEKKDVLNFLFCFDNNYDQQAFSSIISLLDNVNEAIVIHIIYNKDTNYDFIPIKIRDHRFLKNIYVYKFNDMNYNFPNLEDSHLSAATYYRLFLDKYIPDNIEYLTYIDSDMICIKNPLENIKIEIEKLKNSKKIVMARTEYPQTSKNENKIYERLDMVGPYFNAGFLILNLDKWRSDRLTQNLLNEMVELGEKIMHWDQDVLNSYFDGDYIELENVYNFNSFNGLNQKRNSILFLHFIGSKKPWEMSGVFKMYSEDYHLNYRKLYQDYYHIVHSWKKDSIKQLFKNIMTFKFLQLKHPLHFLKNFITSLKN